MDKMREEFEGWATPCHMCTYFDDVEYRHQSTEWAWRAWKASRAALCVELDEIRSKIKSECEKSDYMKSVCWKIIDDIDSIQIERF